MREKRGGRGKESDKKKKVSRVSGKDRRRRKGEEEV